MFLVCWESWGGSERRHSELQVVADALLIPASEFGMHCLSV